MAFSEVEHWRKRREAARDAGLCVTCRKEAPPEGYRVCERCNMLAKNRVARMRERRRQHRQLEQIVRGHEAMGDAATERFAYIEASMQYERALAQGSTVEDEVRLCEKIGTSTAYGARPDLAARWFERALQRCEATDSLHWKIPHVMMHFPHVCWIASRTGEGMAYLERAREHLESNPEHPLSGSETLVQRMNSLAGNYLILLGKYDAAAAFLRSRDYRLGPHVQTTGTSHTLRAILHAIEGDAEEAFAAFDKATEIARAIPDGYVMTMFLDDYANWAMALGRLDRARDCRERALLVARERRVAWRIPYLTLRFANLLLMAGDYNHARDLLSDAMSYDTETPVIRVLKTTIAVELAQAIGDNELLKRALDDDALELVFRSGEPQRIGAFTAAYVKVAVSRGQLSRARKLIARAMAVLTLADENSDLLGLAARYGSPQDALRARELLVERMRLPHHRVTQAYLDVWEAQHAMRVRATNQAKEYAARAAYAFGRLGWKHQQREALALTRKAPAVAFQAPQTPMLTELTTVLTHREQQVAELVLRGFSNRIVAEMLSISEHTVEAHMTSILNRLGLRSRWQLRDLARE